MVDDEIKQRAYGKKNCQIAALKAGSASAWKEVLACHGSSLLSYAARMLGDKGAAEEIVQDTLVNVFRTIDRFDGQCSFKSWLYRAVRNRSIDEIRRRKRYIDVGDDPEQYYFGAAGRWHHDCPGWDGPIARQLDDKRLLNVVRQEIDLLPHSHREVLLLKEVEGLPSKEICAALEISPGNLRIRIHRARTALRAAVVHAMREE